MKSFSYAIQTGLSAFLLSGAACAAPQTVYRCGDSYSQTPCANGTVVQADDPRDDSQRAAAKTALNRDKALVKDIEATRRKDVAEEQALNKAALSKAHAAHAADDKRAETKKAPNKRTAKVREEAAGVFTVTAPALKRTARPSH